MHIHSVAPQAASFPPNLPLHMTIPASVFQPGLTVQDSLRLGQDQSQATPMSFHLSGGPRMPYAIVEITCAMPMSPIVSSGETSRVNDLDRVSPTRQSSSMGSHWSNLVFKIPILGWATIDTCAVPPAEMAIVADGKYRWGTYHRSTYSATLDSQSNSDN